MNGKCNLSICGVEDGLPCEMGTLDMTACPHFKLTKQAAVVVPDNTNLDQSGQRLPWTGRAMGLSDISLASARSTATLVGLVGPFNAGKTAFLTSLFAHFSRIGVVGKFSFAGSYTLQAWDHLKQFTQWPSNFGPAFPPHTPDSAERVPSLLHLAFRKADEAIHDVLFTDAPGEWFSRWIKNQSATSAEGARWIVKNAAHFLFFTDRSALTGPDLGKVRNDTLQLARLLGEKLDSRALTAIWAKSDLETDPAIEEPIRTKLHKFFGDHPSFNLDIGSSDCLRVLELILAAPKAEPLQAFAASISTKSAFVAYKQSYGA